MKATARKWFYGLAAAFVGGLTSAIDSSLALMVLVPEKFNLSEGLHRMLLTALVLGILTGVKCACAYLKQSPLPPEAEDVPVNLKP